MAHDDQRDLILGLLAQRLGLVAPADALRALEARRGAADRSVLEAFVAEGLITPVTRSLLESLGDELVRRQGGDTAAALTALLGGMAPPDDERTQAMPGGGIPGARYEILAELTSGGMGRILRANDAMLGREVLLKQIKEDVSPSASTRGMDPASLALFAREWRTAAALEHPNIVPVYDAGDHGDGRPYYVMRYVRGDTLKQALSRHHPAPPGQSPAERTLALRDLLGRFVAVCGAVAYAHARGVLHRDIKPANILIGDFGEAQLIDWGLARVDAELAAREAPLSGADSTGVRPVSLDDSCSEPTRYGQAKGTPAYMAPEQASGALDRFSPATDVYGLGATLYHLLAGRAPFVGDASEFTPDVIRGIFPRPRQVNPEVAPPLEAICLRAMAREPADRYPSPREFAADIGRWLADEPVSVYRDPWTTRAARFAKRHRTAVTAAGVLLATSLAGLAVGNVLVRRERDVARATAAAATAVIETLGKEIGDDAWALVPNAELNRLTMVHEVNRQLENLLVAQPNDRSRRLQAVDGYRREGNLARMLARFGVAERCYARADALLAELFAADPGDPAAVGERLNLESEQCVLRHFRGDPAAGEAYRRALERAAELQRQFPRTDVRGMTARLQADYGGWLVDDGRPAEGVAVLRKAVDGLVAVGPSIQDGIDHSQLLLVATLCTLSRAEEEAGDAPAALATADRAVAAAAAGIDAATNRNHPDLVQVKARALLRRAGVEAGPADRPERIERALSTASEAVEIYRALAARNRKISWHHDHLADALARRAEWLHALGRPDEAAADVAAALAEVTWRETQADLVNTEHETGARAWLARATLAADAGDVANARAALGEARTRIAEALRITPRGPDALRLQRRIDEIGRALGPPAE